MNENINQLVKNTRTLIHQLCIKLGPCTNKYGFENDVLFSNDTDILGKRNSEFSQQESNLQPSDYWFRRSTTELQETRGS